MSELYRDFIDNEMDDVITALNGTITPTPVNSELYRNFLNRKADDIITALNGTITPAPIGDELYRDFIERKFDDVIAGIGGYVPPVTFPSVSGAVCSFDSQYAGLPLKSHVVQLTAKQSGSGTPSPSNPRPITGYSAINISHSDADTSNPTVYTIQIGSTIYGGNYDAVSGVLTVTHGCVKFGDCTFNYFANGSKSSAYRVNLPTPTTTCASNQRHGAISSMAGVEQTAYWGGVRVNEIDESCFAITTDGLKVCIYDTDTSITQADFLTKYSDCQIFYPLATPQTIQLPPCPIDTLEGVNNIWADTGDTTLQYIKIGGNT